MREGAAHVGGGTVAIVGQALDVDANAGRTVALVGYLLEVGGIRTGTEGLVDGDLNLVLGHGVALGLGDCRRKGGVVLGIGVAALLGCDGDDAAELGEHRGALGILRRLAMLGGCPLGMSGHE